MREKIIDLLYSENVRSDCGIERLADEICAIDPVKHGRWEFEPGVMYCSVCGWIFEYYAGLEEEWNYCPHCGARRGEEDDVNV